MSTILCLFSAIKTLIVINRINTIKKCLHDICVCVLSIIMYIYIIHAYACIYLRKKYVAYIYYIFV